MSAKPAGTYHSTSPVERRIELQRRFLLAALANPRIAEDVPHDVQLFLLPDDDPAFATTEIAAAARAAAHGDNVYLRHVRLADLPD